MSVQNKPVSKILCLFSKFCHLESMKLMKSNNFTKKKKKRQHLMIPVKPQLLEEFVCKSLLYNIFSHIYHISICMFSENQFHKVNIKTNKQKKVHNSEVSVVI